MPAGQGSAAKVQVVRFDQASPPNVDSSNTGYSVSYLAPTLTRVEVWENGAVSSTVSAPFNAKVNVPTDGSAQLRLIGSNLGNAPVMLIGDYAYCYGPGGSIGLPATECPGTAGTHTCYMLASPPGEGDGMRRRRRVKCLMSAVPVTR
jgi:hypothetical protein